MEEENGFYKPEIGAKRTILLFATHLESLEYTLDIDSKDTHSYPVDGWTYFGTLAEACQFYNIDEEEYKEELFPEENFEDLV